MNDGLPLDALPPRFSPSVTATPGPPAPATDARLSALAVRAGDTDLRLPFDADTTDYRLTARAAALTVTPTVADPQARVTVAGAAVTSGGPGAEIALTGGMNVIRVVVTAVDGTTTRTYTLTVEADGSSRPLNLAVAPAASAGAPALRVTWDGYRGVIPPGEDDTPSVAYRRVSGAADWSVQGVTVFGRGNASITATIASLQPATRYEVRAGRRPADAWKEIREVTTWALPAAPAAVSVSAGGRSLAVRWQLPATAAGAAPVTGWRVRWRTAAVGNGMPGAWQDADGDSADQLGELVSGAVSAAYRITGLTAGAAYEVQVAAQSGIGAGAFSAVAAGTPLPSADARLQALRVEYGSGPTPVALSPAFDAGTTSYRGNVSPGASSLTVTVTPAAAAGARATVDGAEVAAGAGAAVALAQGANLIRVGVVAEDGIATRTYTLAVGLNHAAGSSLAGLQALPAAIGGTPGLRLSWTGAQAGQVQHRPVSGATGWSGSGVTAAPGRRGATIGGLRPATRYDVRVGTTSAWHEITQAATWALPGEPAVRAEAGVEEIVVRWQPPAAAAGVAPLTGWRVRWRTAALGSTAPGAWQDANGDSADGEPVSGAGADRYAITGLANGTAYEVQVAAQSGVGAGAWAAAAATPARRSTDLSALAVAPGTLVPAFDRGVTAYDVRVAGTAGRVTVTPTAADAGAMVTVAGAAADAGGVAVALHYGHNPVAVVVTAADAATTKTYTVTVTRPPGPVRSLTAAAGAERLLVSWAVPAGLSEALFAAWRVRWRTAAVGTAAAGAWQDAAGASDDGERVAGARYAIADLSANASYEVEVRGELRRGGVTPWARASGTPLRSANAALAALVVAPGTLRPPFDAATGSYEVTVGGGAVSLTVTPQAAHADASVTVNGAAVAGGAHGVVALAAGANAVRVAVTAADGTTVRAYDVAVERVDAAAPARPTGLQAEPVAVAGTPGLAVSWTAPAGATAAVLQYREAGAYRWETARGAGVSGGRIGGLRPGVRYEVSVTAGVPAAGGGTRWSRGASTAAVTWDVPGPPAGLAAEPRAGALAVSWTAPADSGYAAAQIVGWRVRWRTAALAGGEPGAWQDARGASEAGEAVAAAATGYVITGLAGARYEVQAAAANAVGAGAFADAVAAAPIGVAGPPREVRSAPADGALRVSWRAPASAGGVGRAIAGYRVRWRTAAAGLAPAGRWRDAQGPSAAGELVAGALGAVPTSYVIGGLANGTAYEVEVAAENDAGARGAYAGRVAGTPRAAASDAGLAGLAVSAGTLRPAFTAERTAYEVGVGGEVETLRVTATAADAGAVIAVDGVAVASGTASGAIALEGGQNVIEVRVTAADGVSERGYRIVVEVAGVGDFAVAGLQAAAAVAGGTPGLAVTWKLPAAAAQAQYRLALEWRRAGAGADAWSGAGAQVGDDGVSGTIAELAPGVRYDVRVGVTTSAGTRWALAQATTWTAPGPPRQVRVQEGFGALLVTWAAPASDGGSPLSGWRVRWRTPARAATAERSAVAAGAWQDAQGAAPNGQAVPGAEVIHYFIDALTSATTYEVQVAAVNGIGAGAFSARVPGTTEALPPAPAGLTVTPAAAAGEPALEVAWETVPGAVSYLVSSRPTGALFPDTRRVAAPATAVTLNGLARNTHHWVGVSADSGPTTFVAAITWDAPSRPLGVAVTAGAGQLAVRWSAPVNAGGAGAAVSGWRVRWRTAAPGVPAGEWQDAAGADEDGEELGGAGLRAWTITGLADQVRHEVQVAAVNELGIGAWSQPVFAAPRRAAGAAPPGAPTGVAVRAGDEALTVTWTAPADDGGAALSGFRVRWRTAAAGNGEPGAWQDADGDSADGQGERVSGAATAHYAITGLTGGVRYEVGVAAENSAGVGAWSQPAFAAPRADAALSGLALSAGALNPDFAADTLAYTAQVDNSVASVTVTPAARDAGASVTVDGAAVAGGTASGAIALHGGENLIRVVVTAADGQTTRSYLITVTRATARQKTPPSLTVTPQVTGGKPSLEVSFDSVAGFSIYEVGYRPFGDAGWTDFLLIYDRGNITRTVPDPRPGTRYDVRIRGWESDTANRGWGRYAVVSAVTLDVPGAPRAVAVSRGASELRVTWEPPADDGGAALSGFRVRWRTAAVTGMGVADAPAGDWQDANGVSEAGAAVTGGAVRAWTITSLDNGVRYEVEVAAANALGAGAWSPAASGTPVSPPGAPTALQVAAGSGELAVSWEPPADDGGAALSGWRVRWRTAAGPGDWQDAAGAHDGGAAVSGGAARGWTITRLAGGVRYEVQVAAANAAGVGAWSPAASGAPDAAPGVTLDTDGLALVEGGADRYTAVLATRPPGPVTIAVEGSVAGAVTVAPARLTFTAANWEQAQTVTVTAPEDADAEDERTVLSHVVSGYGAVGAAASVPVEVRDNDPPAPQGVQVAAQFGVDGAALRVTWQAVAEATDYLVEYRLAAQQQAGTAPWRDERMTRAGEAATIAGLAWDREYEVRVAALTAFGVSRHAHGAGDTYGAPGAPRRLRLTPGAGQIVAAWEPPEAKPEPPTGKARPGARTGWRVRWRVAAGVGQPGAWQPAAAGLLRTADSAGFTISRLVDETTYEVQVAAVTAAGPGPFAAARATPTTRSQDAALGALALSAGTLDPAFDAAVTDYVASVGHGVGSVTVTARTRHAGARIAVNGAAATAGEASAPVLLAVGANPIAVAVIAEDGRTTVAYRVAVTRAALGLAQPQDRSVPRNVALELELPAAAGGAGELAYALAPAAGTLAEKLPGLTWTAATRTLAGTPTTKTAQPVALTYRVTDAAGNTDARTFTVAVTASSNAALGGLTVTPAAELSPAFAPATVAYAATVANGVARVTVTPTTADANATVTVDGAAVASGAASAAVALAPGVERAVAIEVTAEDERAMALYRLAVTRAAGAPAAPPAPALTAGRGRLDAAWSEPDANGAPITGYRVAYSADGGVTWTPVAHSGVARAATLSGLTDGQTYQVRVAAANRAGLGAWSPAASGDPGASGDARLGALTLTGSDGAVLAPQPALAAGAAVMRAHAGSEVTEVSVAARARHFAATVSVAGTPLGAGQEAATVSLGHGENPIAITVTAEDGSARSYRVTVLRARLLTIVLSAPRRQYGDADDLGYAVRGLRAEDEASSVLTGALRRETGDAVGVYLVSLGTLAVAPAYAGRYELPPTPHPSSYEIAVRALTYSSTAADKVYDGTDAAPGDLGGSFSPAPVAGEEVTVSGGRYADAAAGTDKAVTGAAAGGADLGNYAVTIGAISGAITPRPAVWMATMTSKVYDGTDAAPAGFAAGLTSADILSADAAEVAAAAGAYDSADVAAASGIGVILSGAKADNYAPAAVAGTITARPITAVGGVRVVTRPVDGTVDAVFDTTRATGAGLVPAELDDFRGGGLTVSGVFPSAAAGAHTLQVSYTLADRGAFKAGNYALAEGTASGTLAGVIALAAALDDVTVAAPGLTAEVDLSVAFRDTLADAESYEAVSDAPSIAAAAVADTVLTVTGVASGSTTLTVTAVNQGGSMAQGSFTATVKAAPAVSRELADVAVAAGDTSAAVALGDHFEDADGDALTFTAESSAQTVATAEVDAGAGTLTVTGGAAAGRATVTVTAADTDGNTVSDGFAVNVKTSPAVTAALGAVTVRAVGESATVDLGAHFGDADGDALTFTAESSAQTVATAEVDAGAGTLTVTGGAAAGRATVTVTAADTDGNTVSDGFAVNVKTSPAVTAALGAVTVRAVGESATVDLGAHFGDADGDALTFTAESSALSIAAAAVADTVLTVTGVARGSATLTVTATDADRNAASDTLAVTVKTAPAVARELADVTVAAGDTSAAVALGDHFEDADGDALTFTAESSAQTVATAEVDAVAGTLTVTGGAAAGRATVTVTAADADRNAVSDAFTVTVKTAPTVRKAFADRTVQDGNSLGPIYLWRHFGDADGDWLTFTAESSAQTVATAEVVANSWLWVEGKRVGSATVTVTAADADGNTASATFATTVTADRNRAPQVVGQARVDVTIPSLTRSQTLDVKSRFRDEDGDVLTYCRSPTTSPSSSRRWTTTPARCRSAAGHAAAPRWR